MPHSRVKIFGTWRSLSRDGQYIVDASHRKPNHKIHGNGSWVTPSQFQIENGVSDRSLLRLVSQAAHEVLLIGLCMN
jgi:hypothetical protein